MFCERVPTNVSRALRGRSFLVLRNKLRVLKSKEFLRNTPQIKHRSLGIWEAVTVKAAGVVWCNEVHHFPFQNIRRKEERKQAARLGHNSGCLFLVPFITTLLTWEYYLACHCDYRLVHDNTLHGNCTIYLSHGNYTIYLSHGNILHINCNDHLHHGNTLLSNLEQTSLTVLKESPPLP